MSEDWSFTRSSLYAACPRAFYFSRKLGSYEGPNDTSFPARNPLNLSSLVGVAVHRSIADQIERWARGEPMDLRKAQLTAEGWLTYMWENAGRLIVEATNDQELDPVLLPKLTHAAKSRIHTFFLAVWPQFRGHTYLLHETLRSFLLHGCRVWIKVDLCTRNSNEETVITDWKTGQRSVLRGGVLQMSVYALWAADRFSEEPTDVYVQLANLKTGGVVPRKLSFRQLNRAIERVLADCHKWSSGTIGDYTPEPDVRKCSSCRHLEMCLEGQEVTGMQG